MSEYELNIRLNKIDISLDLLAKVDLRLAKITSEFAESCDNVETYLDENAEANDEKTNPELEKLSNTGLRRLYYSIARTLHPDKNIDLLEQCKDIPELLTQSKKCYQCRDLIGLIILARSLDISIAVWIKADDYPMLDYNITQLQQEIEEKINSPLWKLAHKSEEERQKYTQTFWENHK